MKIALFYYSNPLKEGGTGRFLVNLVRCFKDKEQELYFFNPYYDGINSIRINEFKRLNPKNVFNSLKKRDFLMKTVQAFSGLFKDEYLSRTDKLKMLLLPLVKPRIFYNNLVTITQIYSKFKTLDIDVILAGSTSTELVTLVFYLSRMFKKKVAAFTYGNDFLVNTRYSIKTYYLRNLDLIFLGTNTMKEIIQKIHPVKEERLAVVYWGLIFDDYVISRTKEELRKELSISDDTFVVLSVGRHVSRKKFDIVILAIAEILDRRLDINLKYYLIGEGEETPSLKKLVKELNINDVVKFLGFTSNEIRNKFYKASDVYIMPSSIEKKSIEGLGITFIEANYYNCPVIGTSSGGIKEAVIENETGLLVKENDVNDLVDKIMYLYNNRDLSRELGIKGHKRALKYFNLKRLVNNYIGVLEKLNKK
ncbi:MAG: glycosyltransferase family 4 protein [Promethearchaeota archaeon]